MNPELLAKGIFRLITVVLITLPLALWLDPPWYGTAAIAYVAILLDVAASR